MSLVGHAESHVYLAVPFLVPHGVAWKHRPCWAPESRPSCRTEPARDGRPGARPGLVAPNTTYDYFHILIIIMHVDVSLPRVSGRRLKQGKGRGQRRRNEVYVHMQMQYPRPPTTVKCPLQKSCLLKCNKNVHTHTSEIIPLRTYIKL